MNILLINHYAGSLKYGMEYRPYYLAREWVRRGHSVTIAAATFSHVRSIQPETRGGVSAEMIDGIQYLWLKTPAYAGNGIARAANMAVFVSRLRMQASRIARDMKPGVVIASSTYPLDIYPAQAIARFAGARLLFEVHDLWPLSPMELGGLSSRHPFILVMQAAENHAYRHADAIVSMLPAARDHMQAHGMSPDKFVHIPNGIDAGEWQVAHEQLPAEHSGLLARFRREKRFILCYAGAHGIANALGSMIDAADMMVDELVAFVLVGQGPEKSALRSQAARLGLKNVSFLPPVPKAAMPALLAASDALFIGLQDQPLFRFGVSPNKLMDYMMASKPVISAIRAGNDMVRDSGCGLSITPEDPAALAAAVRTLQRMSQSDRDALGERGRRHVLQHHDYRVLAHSFTEVMVPEEKKL